MHPTYLFFDFHELVRLGIFLQWITEGRCEYSSKVITNEYSAKERETLYLMGGTLFVTSLILLMDFLRKQCPIEKVQGLLVTTPTSK